MYLCNWLEAFSLYYKICDQVKAAFTAKLQISALQSLVQGRAMLWGVFTYCSQKILKLKVSVCSSKIVLQRKEACKIVLRLDEYHNLGLLKRNLFFAAMPV
jgi:hypothetical protein